MTIKTAPTIACMLIALCFTTTAGAQTTSLKITAMKAMLFCEDKGTLESSGIVVRRIIPIRIPVQVSSDKFYAGFWLYETGCNPVRLTARIFGPKRTSVVKKVIKFGCGE